MKSLCKYCNNEFDKKKIASHVRWCSENPNLLDYKENLKKARSNITKSSRKQAAKKISKRHEEGCYSHLDRGFFRGHTHTNETKERIRKSSLESDHRRLKKNTVEYKGVLLDSTWELVLAKRLDEVGIKWIRPKPIKWIDENGITHNYFPDFYLEEYDLYLDPKNPHAVRVQKKKLNQLLTQYDNIIILKSIEECESFLK